MQRWRKHKSPDVHNNAVAADLKGCCRSVGGSPLGSPSSPRWKFCFPRLLSLSQLFAAQVPLTKLMCVWLRRSDSGLFVCLQDFAGGCCRSSLSSSPPFQRSSGLCLRTTHCIKTKKCRDTNNDSGAWGLGLGGGGLVATADWCCQWEYVCVDAGSQGRTTKKCENWKKCSLFLPAVLKCVQKKCCRCVLILVPCACCFSHHFRSRASAVSQLSSHRLPLL